MFIKNGDRVYLKNSLAKQNKPHGRYLTVIALNKQTDEVYLVVHDNIFDKLWSILPTDIDRTKPLIRNGRKIRLVNEEIRIDLKLFKS
jgi:hypothetical protein